jgi:hypothetical protein
MAADGTVDRIMRSRAQLWAGAAALMLLPVLGIRGTARANWDLPGDLMFLFILLGGVVFAHELTVRVPCRSAYRAAVALSFITALSSAWINLAVGIIGSEDNPANLIYAGVIAVAVIGGVLGRFRPRAMVLTMLATAAAQVLVFVIALAVGLGFTGPITVFFTALWLASAALFKRAEEHSRQVPD